MCLRFQRYSIMFWFTNDTVKVFSLFSNDPSLKHWHVDGKINLVAWLFHGHFLPAICSFRGWVYSHRASYILCRTLWKMKMGTLCSKIIKNFHMAAQQSMKPRAGAFEVRGPLWTAEAAHPWCPSWVAEEGWRGNQTYRHFLCDFHGFSDTKEKVSLILAGEYQWQDETSLHRRGNET